MALSGSGYWDQRVYAAIMVLMLRELVMAWGRGWTITRNTPAPVVIPGGFRVDVGLPGHRVRYVLHTYDASRLIELGNELTAPGTWLKIAGDRRSLRDALPAAWTMDVPGNLMTTVITRTRVELPAGYIAHTIVDGEAVIATVLDSNGEQASSALLGCSGEFAVFDMVVTEPEHRRRGLGSVVMGLLTNHAADAGMSTGILLSNEAGRALYQVLGWSVNSEVSGAFIADEPTAGTTG